MDKKVMDVRLKSWIPVFEEQARSGLTKQAFCEKNNIKRGDFFYWQRQAREYFLDQQEETKSSSKTTEKEETALGFYEISAPKAVSKPQTEIVAKTYEPLVQMPSSISISYGGFTIEMHGEVNEPALCAILKAVKHAD
ncbi:hypothetical protein SAMN02910384_03349 [Pseudobutyrivibrio sp. ACV-2]|uniref:IS66 family insertion sequence element accessory protein TnpA n=3 Tax=Pseudobutyrivibrio sp. ACV-2 TaxID=1520801 RepID=UPI000899BA72|nr:hypothetical protein [Pseudobutyrivibrio sp. ACV-2]SEB07836.1 hypothetical protein SAMN02910384_03349 [Pseudobutyrivibrio sp. ACV-2]